MKKMQKGFSLVMAIMVSICLVIMALGLLAIVDFSRNSVQKNADDIKLYWMAESASNYNVRWWVNQPDSIRKKWPCVYTHDGQTFKDENGEQAIVSIFPKTDNMIIGNYVYLHQSSKINGNIETVNDDLDIDRYKLFNVRYKAPRKDFPNQAVWILDSYAWDKQTGNMINICLTNVYNYMNEGELEPFINAELINSTLAGAGFHGVKGRFNEQDSRYGQCTFGGLIHLDFTTGELKDGPRFYGLVKSYAPQQSWYKNDGNLMTITSDYGLGLGLNSSKISDEPTAVIYAQSSLLGGYEKNCKPVDVEAIVWDWNEVVSHGAENHIYFPDLSLFPTGTIVNVELKVEWANGVEVTKAYLYKNGSTTPTKILTIGNSQGTFSGVALDKNYKIATIQGISKNDFSLITETAQVQITDNLYLSEMEDSYSWLYGTHSDFTLENPSPDILQRLWEDMITYNPKGHLAVISGIGMTSAEFDKSFPPIYFPNEKLIYSNCAYVSKFGELSAKGVGITDLKLFNIGPSIVLDQQEIMSGAADTAQKWPKAFIQDQRYLRPCEPLPPCCGEGPGEHPNEDTNGLNRNHRWSTVNFGNNNNPLDIIIK